MKKHEQGKINGSMLGGDQSKKVEENAIAQILSKIRIEKAEICLAGSAYSLLFSQVKLDEMDW